jgi:hypothetical protein
MRTKFGSASFPSSSIFSPFELSSGRYSFDTDGRERHLGRRDLELGQREAGQHVGKRAGRGHGHGLALEVFDLVDACLDHDAMRDDDPVATHDLHVAATHVDRDGALDAAFVAVELAGEQRLEPNLVILDLEQIELEALLFGKAPLRRHQQKAGIGLRRDDPMFPGFGRLPERRARGGGKQRAGRHQPDEDECCHLVMAFQFWPRDSWFLLGSSAAARGSSSKTPLKDHAHGLR